MLSMLRSWGESLSYLAPSSLKAWGLLTLKGALATYRLLFVRYWWFTLSLVLSRWFLSEYRYEAIVWILVCFLAVRPSIAKKDIQYFVSYWAHCLVSLVLLVVSALLVLAAGYLNYASYILRYQGSGLLVVATVFALFFLFDAKVSFFSLFKSVWNGIKLTLYMLPLCILICFCWQLLEYLVHAVFFVNALSYGVLELLVLLGVPFYLHILLYMYIKQIYGHPERYE